MWDDFPIFGGYDDRADIAFDSEDLINLFMIGDSRGKKKFAFLGTPGVNYELEVKAGNEPSRSLYTYQASMFGVFGDSVYRFTAPLIKNKIGTIGTAQGYVSITGNNNSQGQVIFVDGQKGYTYNLGTGVFAQITASGFPTRPLNVAFLDGYFVVPQGESNAFQICAPNDGTQWDALDVASINAYQGQNVGVGVVNRRLYFFKTDSTEVWYNVGAADFPFRRDNNLLFNFGCLAASSIASDFGFLFWLAKDRNGVGSIMMTTGQVPKKVSNESVDNLIAGFTNPADVTSYIYKDLGHIFYVITWNTDDTTLVYDLTMDNWGQLQMHKTFPVEEDPNSGKVRHISNCHAYYNDRHYVGSYKASVLYDFSRQYAVNQVAEPTEQPNYEEIRRVRVCPHFFDTNYRMLQMKRLQLDMQMGLGLSVVPTAVGANPKVYLRISRDGGNNYGNYHAASVGKIGNRRARAIFRNLGLARDMVAEFSFYDPVLPVAMLGASINYEVLNK